MHKRDLSLGSQTLSIETGRLAKQADGAVIVRMGDTMVLVTACHSSSPREGIDFLPLTVDYREYTYASGRIPGGFFKREGKATEKETLTSRVIDRPIRPLFPSGWAYETQVIAFVLSADTENDSDVLALTGAGAALALSEMPVEKTVAAVRVGLVDGEFIVNPTFPQRKNSRLDLVVAGTADGIVMVEAGANEVSEDEAIQALETAHKAIKQLVEMIDGMAKDAGPQEAGEARGQDRREARRLRRVEGLRGRSTMPCASRARSRTTARSPSSRRTWSPRCPRNSPRRRAKPRRCSMTCRKRRCATRS